ncbi:hypothetical protein [Neorhizobium galegae]|uniref:hypothetical protein n=1 Tax=Neorhizobium galegae TaxID=399 RepID=UPI00210545B8|nr:hypothetical protein [Neorhizobium galegae]MCQ1835156.1 hypothetical protein [Neorhizobium galegae]
MRLQLIQVPRVFLAEFGAKRFVHQMLVQRHQNRLFQLLTFYRQHVGASALVAGRRAAKVFRRHHRYAAMAAATLDQI